MEVVELTLGDFGMLAVTRDGEHLYFRKAQLAGCIVHTVNDQVTMKAGGQTLAMDFSSKDMTAATIEWLKGMLGVEAKTIKVKEDA